jgi:trimethylamine:corrinoid methyltransferase-like protein
VVDEDSLAVDVIGAVMDSERNFLSHAHTVRYLRAGEIFVTRMSDRISWEEWDRTGRKGMGGRAQSEVERLLAEHEVPSLTEDQEQALDEIMQEASNELIST